MEWDNPDKFPAVMRIARIYYAQRYIFCLLILTSWFKLFDYLSVFKGMVDHLQLSLMCRLLIGWFALSCWPQPQSSTV